MEAIYYHHELGFYMLPLAVITSFLETVFLLNYIVEVCTSPSGICHRVWEVVLQLDDWKKGLLFVLVAGPCFASPNTVPLGIVSGSMLALTGLVYCVKTGKTRREAAINNFISKSRYGRFEQEEDAALEEYLEESITNPRCCATALNVADQIEILEV